MNQKIRNMKANKYWIFIIPILLLNFKSDKRDWKAIVPFEHLVYQSELIVYGEISKTDEKVYQFEIAKMIKGNEKVCNEIIIEKWNDWACDVRGKEHKIGQQIILFLKKENPRKESWEIINGSTGEMIIESNKYWIYHKSEIFKSVNLVEKYFKKVGEWKSKINCSSMELTKFRSENAFFDKVFSDMEQLESIEI